MIKKKRKKHDKKVLLGKAKLEPSRILISNTLADSYISHDKSVKLNNLLMENNEIKKEFKNSKNVVEHTT